MKVEPTATVTVLAGCSIKRHEAGIVGRAVVSSRKVKMVWRTSLYNF